MKMQKVPVKKQMIMQFLYKKPVRLVIVTNLYGAFVNNQNAFNECPKLFDVDCLTPKQSYDYIKTLMGSGSHFLEAVAKFNIWCETGAHQHERETSFSD